MFELFKKWKKLHNTIFSIYFFDTNSQVKYIHGGGTLDDWANLSKYVWKSKNYK